MAKFFMNDNAEVVTLSELAIPFICVVTGVRRDVVKSTSPNMSTSSQSDFVEAVGRSASCDGIGKKLVYSDQGFDHERASNRFLWVCAKTAKPSMLWTPSAFSCSVPASSTTTFFEMTPGYNLTRNLLQSHNVDHLIDGGISANVPTRCAWRPFGVTSRPGIASSWGLTVLPPNFAEI